MAYDPKDPADKKIVDALIGEAVEAALEEAQVKFDRVKTRLEGDLKKAREKNPEGGNDAEVERLRNELDTLSTTHAETVKALKTAEKSAQENGDKYETESKANRALLVDNGLSAELTSAKVAAPFMPAVKAMFAPLVEIKSEGDKRVAMVGDKTLADHIKAWAASDEGKHYVAAPMNNGGGSNGGGGNGGGGKQITRQAYDAMDMGARATFFGEGGTIADTAS
jgi:hypothetical protein